MRQTPSFTPNQTVQFIECCDANFTCHVFHMLSWNRDSKPGQYYQDLWLLTTFHSQVSVKIEKKKGQKQQKSKYEHLHQQWNNFIFQLLCVKLFGLVPTKLCFIEAVCHFNHSFTLVSKHFQQKKKNKRGLKYEALSHWAKNNK